MSKYCKWCDSVVDDSDFVDKAGYLYRVGSDFPFMNHFQGCKSCWDKQVVAFKNFSLEFVEVS